ncbi:MAG: sugar phosphate isomerase/epimerase [Clostridia bacterium]|nr:sugar phosphate isomerase/epimerase [Clostridia bacterium]
MIFGNAAWGFRETPIEEQFRITSDMGISELEIGIANAPCDIPLTVDNSGIEKIKKLSLNYGVGISCAATGNDFTVPNNDCEKIKRVIDICNGLGVKYLRIFAGFSAVDEVRGDRFDKMVKSLCEVCNYAKTRSVVPVIETHGGVTGYEDGVEHFMSTTTDLDTLKKILSAIPDNARVCFDPANLYAVGVTKPHEFYKRIRDKVAYAHFKDFKRLPSGHLKPSFCGDSEMDWNAILREMQDFGGICMFEYENTEDIETGLKKSYEYIQGRIQNQ